MARLKTALPSKCSLQCGRSIQCATEQILFWKARSLYRSHTAVVKTIMDVIDPKLYVFDTHVEAEKAIRSLGRTGFDVKKLSLIGKGYHSDERPIGFYTVGDRIKTWGGIGAFWGTIWGLLLGPAFFFIPGIGLVALAGPLGAALVGALEGAAVVGGLSALGAALTSLGVPKDQAIKYETALKADKYVLVVHGSPKDAEKVRSTLENSKITEKA